MSAQLAAQLYTLREFLKTPADIASTLARVRKIGYTAVQVSGLGPIDPKELARILQGEGLTCCVTHGPLQRFQNETQQVIDELHLWGCKYTAIGGYWNDEATEAHWRGFATDFGQLARTFAAGGIGLGYHNHSHEFVRLDSGKTPMQVLMEVCPSEVWFEIDTYWVQHGGADPAAWIDKCFGRIPVVHLKDIAVIRKDGHTEAQMAEIGLGNLNWSRILESCRRAGVQWYAVEQDVCQRNPFESLEISYRNLKMMGF